MSGDRPTAYLLSGLPGSGKSTYARELEARGVARLSVDDVMRRRHGRAGVDYPIDRHLALLERTVQALRADLVRLLGEGRSVVLDHGLGRRAERDEVKRLVEDHGGRWRLLVFRVGRDELVRRLSARGQDDGFGPMDADRLDAIAAASQDPEGEGEEVVLPR